MIMIIVIIARQASRPDLSVPRRKGANGVSTNGVTANLMFFDRGTFWVLSVTYFYLPKRARAYLFPNLSKLITFAAAPLVLTLVVHNESVPNCFGRTRPGCLSRAKLASRPLRAFARSVRPCLPLPLPLSIVDMINVVVQTTSQSHASAPGACGLIAHLQIFCTWPTHSIRVTRFWYFGTQQTNKKKTKQCIYIYIYNIYGISGLGPWKH